MSRDDMPWVVMRSRNDMPLVRQTLEALSRQTVAHRLLVLDNDSTDGTRQEAAQHATRVITVPAGTYVPGRVLNDGMRETDGRFVAFLNSDCTPLDDRWLDRLLSGFDDDQVAAVFGRQVARPGAHPLTVRDTDAAYGNGNAHRTWRHFFSMASSAVRRSAWEALPFDETLRYSEDIDWTWRLRQRGNRIGYVQDSMVYHSHDYTLAELWRRQRGEGIAEARIFPWSPWERTLLRYSILPLGRQVLADWTQLLQNGTVRAALEAPVRRLVQFAGRRVGFMQGIRKDRP
jgi:rhamnosyltransferase